MDIQQSIQTEVSEDILNFLTAVLSENLSELPSRPDVAELKLLMSVLQSANFELFSRSTFNHTTMPAGRINYVQYKVDINLANAIVTACAGSHSEGYAFLSISSSSVEYNSPFYCIYNVDRQPHFST